MTIRVLSSLYVYDSTLLAMLMTGAEVRAYPEYSAGHFVRTAAGAPLDGAKPSNVGGCPDCIYDYVSGLRYEIDVARPAGSRIRNLMYGGAALGDAQQFVVVVNTERGVLDPADFASVDRRLTRDGTPVFRAVSVVGGDSQVPSASGVSRAACRAGGTCRVRGWSPKVVKAVRAGRG